MTLPPPLIIRILNVVSQCHNAQIHQLDVPHGSLICLFAMIMDMYLKIFASISLYGDILRLSATVQYQPVFIRGDIYQYVLGPSTN
jgi:hypothetical protein